MQKPKTFKIGLCLAGAVSAGAYTAGVIDFLLEALEDWQQRKDRGEAGVPQHRVEISVIGGSSAGGMTGMLLAAASRRKILPVIHAPPAFRDEIPDNPLYHSWVDLLEEDMLELLLDSDDISGTELKSLLNAGFVDQIVDRALIAGEPPAVSRPYLSKNLKVFVTLANLNGMDFSIAFRSNVPDRNKYISTSHRDYACFMMADDESEYRNDGFVPLNFEKDLNVEFAKQAALATGAFPIGLPAREMIRNGDFLNELTWLKYISHDAKRPFPTEYQNIHVDGGMINNEPFEKVRMLLDEGSENDDPEAIKSHHTFENTVLMVDPFPSTSDDFQGNTGLFSVIAKTLQAMINQSRIKPKTLIDTMDADNYGQFLIAPVRYVGHEAVEGTEAIACGSVGGFGGFISKEFRVHDYFLGRANCEKFLRDHFTVPLDTTNPIFTDGYAQVKDRTKFQIIPLFSPPKSAPYLPVFKNGTTFPSVNERFIDKYRPKMKKRIEKILLRITDYTRVQRALLWIGGKVLLTGKLADAMLSAMKKSLHNHHLLKP